MTARRQGEPVSLERAATVGIDAVMLTTMVDGPRPYGSSAAALLAVRTAHTLVFLGELAAIGWLVVSGALGRRDRSVAIAAGAVAAEAAVFVANQGVCPLTPLAERLGARSGSVSDIFLPDRVAHTIPIWSTGLVVLGLGLHLRAAISGRARVRRRSS